MTPPHPSDDRRAPGARLRGPVLTLLSGTTLSMALAYLALPLLARLYTPAEFGLADFFVSIVSVLVAIGSFRYEDALMVPEDDDEARSVLTLAFVVLLGVTGVLALLIPWRADVAAFFNLPGIAPWLPLVPLALLLTRLAMLAELWLTRRRRFREVTAGQTIQRTATVGVRLLGGVPPLPGGVGGLVGGYVAGAGLAAGWYAWRARHAQLLRFRALGRLAVRFRRFPLFSMPSTLLNAFVSRLPLLALPFFFDAAVVGLYGRAFTVLAVPLSLVGAAVAQVFFVEAAAARGQGTLAAVTARVYDRLVLVGLVPTAMLMAAGPAVFDFALGPAWAEAGAYLRYVGPWLFLAAVASPLTRLFDVLERQPVDLALSLFMGVVLVLAFWLGGRTGHVATTLAAVGAAGAAARMVHLAVLLRLGGVPPAAALRPFLRYGLAGAPAVGAALLAAAYAPPWATTAVVAGGLLLYGAAVAWRMRALPGRPA